MADYALPQDCNLPVASARKSVVETADDADYAMPQTTPASLAAQMAQMASLKPKESSTPATATDDYHNLQAGVARRDYVNLQQGGAPPPRPPKSAGQSQPPPMPSRQAKPASMVPPAAAPAPHASSNSGGDKPPPLQPVPMPPSEWGGLQLQSQPWYVGRMSSDVAVAHLKYSGPGSFLVRESTNPHRQAMGCALVLSCRSCAAADISKEDVAHLPLAMMQVTDPRTNRQTPRFSLPSVDESRLYATVLDLITAYMEQNPRLYLKKSAV
eukprot:m.40572 g.40572  ORF g.40572 m.40572 type:complete len:269 (-) comp12760_c0_seq1:98-904(-)